MQRCIVQRPRGSIAFTAVSLERLEPRCRTSYIEQVRIRRCDNDEEYTRQKPFLDLNDEVSSGCDEMG
jgi:hypothetical protein